MKLISKETWLCDPKTFEPHIRVTIDLPIKILKDDGVDNTDEFYCSIGKQFISLLEHK